MILEEGIENRFKRHHVAAEAIRKAAQSLGFELFPEKEIVSDTVTAIRIPDGIDCRKVLDIMKEEYGVIISGGLERLSTSIWRIGHMGMTASPDFILPTLNAFEKALKEVGYPVELGKGIDVASNVFNGNRSN